VLLTYGDDSSDRTRSRVFAASTVYANKDEWHRFALAWKERNGDRPFHATDCETDQGDFRETNHEDNKRLYGLVP
jgi:hypothetical protein